MLSASEVRCFTLYICIYAVVVVFHYACAVRCDAMQCSATCSCGGGWKPVFIVGLQWGLNIVFNSVYTLQYITKCHTWIPKWNKRNFLMAFANQAGRIIQLFSPTAI